MSTGLKAIGIVGVVAVIALGFSASEPSPASTIAPSLIVAPKNVEATVVTPTLNPTTKVTPKPVVTETKQESNCHPSYSGCLKMNAGDYDCAGGSGNGPNYTGKVRVYGSDPFGLDRDNDGWGCE